MGIPSLVVQGDGISSSNHFFSSALPLAARLGAGPTAPDLVWLQRSPHRRRLSCQSFWFLVSSCASVSLWLPARAPLQHFFCSFPWRRVICRMSARMLWCSSLHPLLPLTTEIEWEKPEEGERDREREREGEKGGGGGSTPHSVQLYCSTNGSAPHS